MATITLSPVEIVANVERDSPSATLGQDVTSVDVQLTDAAGHATPSGSSTWLHTPGNLLQWGVQRSRDGGVTWLEPDGGWFRSQTDIPVGTLTRDGKLPRLAVSSDSLVAAAGDRFRLAVLADAAITLGAVITIT